MNGPNAYGSNPDVLIFGNRMKARLDPGEIVLADEGYKDERCLLSQHVPVHDRAIRGSIRTRQEAVNKRFKQFAALTSCYRHDLDLHQFLFHSTANITHLIMVNEEPLFKSRVL